ncbi:hypothetical protein B0H14DRAFT_2574327 [Mycena olivaceomarginata]|nr:hypothetical protein B0H14DRAFT_2574327 [Mycena olivaceomarginata]
MPRAWQVQGVDYSERQAEPSDALQKFFFRNSGTDVATRGIERGELWVNKNKHTKGGRGKVGTHWKGGNGAEKDGINEKDGIKRDNPNVEDKSAGLGGSRAPIVVEPFGGPRIVGRWRRAATTIGLKPSGVDLMKLHQNITWSLNGIQAGGLP